MYWTATSCISLADSATAREHCGSGLLAAPSWPPKTWPNCQHVASRLDDGIVPVARQLDGPQQKTSRFSSHTCVWSRVLKEGLSLKG